jgi:hypothetical protein
MTATPTPTGMWPASCPHCPWLGTATTPAAAESMRQTHLNQHRRTQP